MEPARLARILYEESEYGQAESVDLVAAVGHCGVEVPEQTALVRERNLPDAEEAQDVVDAESVEVLGHGAQAGLPPGIVVLRHLLPVIGGETPVLAVPAEEIRRSARARIQIVELRIARCVHAVASDSDGEVSLEENTLLVSVLHGA